MVVRRIVLIPVPVLVVFAWATLALFSRPNTAPVAPAAPQTATLCVQAGNLSCFSTINAALASAQSGDTIRVATGAYIEYLTITQTLTLQGGWNSTFTLRDPVAYPTHIRPPDDTFSVVYIQGIFANSSAVAPTLDGFIISGGGGGNHGGGLRVTNSDALISNNIITGNIGYLLGGGVWVQNGAPTLLNNRIENNHIMPGSGGWGGGVELENTRAALIGNVIAGNAISDSYGYGGGVAVQSGGPVTLTGNTIINNAAAITTSVIPQQNVGYGGGVYVWDAPVILASNVVQGNSANAVVASGFGGAFGYGGGIYIANTAALSLTGNSILSNTASYKHNAYPSGGGIEINTSTGLLTGNIIAGNRANGNMLFGNGGGIASYTSTLSIVGGQIINNKTALNCEGYGGGVYASNSKITLDAVRVENNCAANTPSYGLGGGFAFINSPYTLTNLIVTRNYAFANDTAVGGLFANAASPGVVVNNSFVNNKGQGIRTAAPIILTNNIIMSHTTGISLTAVVAVSATFNNFYANTTHQRGFPLDITNIIINPQLDANFHLLPGSPLIDAGTRLNAPFHAINFQPRPMAGTSGFYRMDIGAHEFTGTAQINRNLATQPADFTLIGPGNPLDNPSSTGSNDWIGNAAFGGDINGDGRDDLIVGAQNHSDIFDGGPNDSGHVYALYNTSARRMGMTDLLTTTASLEVRSWLNQQHLGQSFAAADVNGDGKRDMIAGSTGASVFGVTGTVYVFAGGTGLTGVQTLSPTMQASYRFRSDQNTSTFGGSNALAAGQLGGSAGPYDIAVGEAGASHGALAQAGAIYVFFGSSGLPALWDMQTLSASLTIHGPAAGAELGKVVIADVNGDNKPDLVARSPLTLYVFYGPLAAGVIDLGVTPASYARGNLSDGPLATGDVDGDGTGDIVLGSGSQILVLRGGSFTTQITVTGVTPSALHTLDWNGDGKADIAIGEQTIEHTYIVMGGALGGTANILDRADRVIKGAQAGERLGWSLGSGDLDADNTSDLIIGSRTHVLSNRNDPNFNDAGAIYVLYGQPLYWHKIYMPLTLHP